MINRYPSEQAQIFGEDPSLYERFRPGYPRELMEAVVADTGDGPVLEIGAGTGKATRALVALGKQIHALEPDARMASVLQVTCGDGLIGLEQHTLEHANLPHERFSLAVAAQSGSVVAVDDRGSASRVVTWMDTRARPVVERRSTDSIVDQGGKYWWGSLIGITVARSADRSANVAIASPLYSKMEMQNRYTTEMLISG